MFFVFGYWISGSVCIDFVVEDLGFRISCLLICVRILVFGFRVCCFVFGFGFSDFVCVVSFVEDLGF